MAALTLKSIPSSIHRELRRRAIRHHRSLNSEIIACLEQVLGIQKVDPESVLLKAETLRAKIKGKLTDRMLLSIKNQGRP